MKKNLVLFIAMIYGPFAFASNYDLTHPVCDIIKESVSRGWDDKLCSEIEASLKDRPLTVSDNQYCYHRADIPLNPEGTFADDETIQKPIIYAYKLKALQAANCLSALGSPLTGTSRIRDRLDGNDFFYRWLPAGLHFLEAHFFELTEENGVDYRAKAVLQPGPIQNYRHVKIDSHIINEAGFYGTQAIHFLAGYFKIFQCQPQAMLVALASNANANAYFRPEMIWYFSTPLDIFMESGFGELENCKETLKVLLTFGANPNLTEQDRRNAGCNSLCKKGDTELFETLKARKDVSDQFKHDIAEILAPSHTKSVPCLKLEGSQRYEQCPWLKGLL